MPDYLHTNQSWGWARNLQLRPSLLGLLRRLINERLKPPGAAPARPRWPDARIRRSAEAPDARPKARAVTPTRRGGTNEGHLGRALLATLLVAGACAATAGSASAQVWWSSNGDCNFSGQCGVKDANGVPNGANYLYNNYAQGSCGTAGNCYDEWGQEADPGGYCVYYQGPAINNNLDNQVGALQYTGWTPDRPYSSYQVGTPSGLTGVGCGMEQSVSEMWTDGGWPSCSYSGGFSWCGGVRWIWLPAGAYPWPAGTGGLTMSEFVDPSGSALPATVNLGTNGFFYHILCALLKVNTVGGSGSQNFELCYTPWQAGPGCSILASANAAPSPDICTSAGGNGGNISGGFSLFGNAEIGGTPTQTGPNTPLGQTPAFRVILDSNQPGYGTWSNGSTDYSGPPALSYYNIATSASQLSAAENFANQYIETNNDGQCGTGAYYVEDPPHSNGTKQCYQLYATGGNPGAELIALEQDGEGPNTNSFGFSQSELQVSSP